MANYVFHIDPNVATKGDGSIASPLKTITDLSDINLNLTNNGTLYLLLKNGEDSVVDQTLSAARTKKDLNWSVDATSNLILLGDNPKAYAVPNTYALTLPSSLGLFNAFRKIKVFNFHFSTDGTDSFLFDRLDKVDWEFVNVYQKDGGNKGGVCAYNSGTGAGVNVLNISNSAFKFTNRWLGLPSSYIRLEGTVQDSIFLGIGSQLFTTYAGSTVSLNNLITDAPTVLSGSGTADYIASPNAEGTNHIEESNASALYPNLSTGDFRLASGSPYLNNGRNSGIRGVNPEGATFTTPTQPALDFDCFVKENYVKAGDTVQLYPVHGTIQSVVLGGVNLTVTSDQVTLPELHETSYDDFGQVALVVSDGTTIINVNVTYVARQDEAADPIALPISSTGLLQNAAANIATGDKLWTHITSGTGTVNTDGSVTNHSDPCVIDVAVYDESESGWTNKQTVTLNAGAVTNTPPTINGLNAAGTAQESTTQKQTFTVSSLESGTVTLSDSTYASLSSSNGIYTLTVNLPSHATAQQITFDVIANDGVNPAVPQTITYNVTQAAITPAQVGVRFKLKRPDGQPVASEQLTALFIDGSNITSSTITTSSQGFVEMTNTPASALGETLRLALIKDGAKINDDEMLIRRVRSVDLNNAAARSDA